MAPSKTATNRLKRELVRLHDDPAPGILAEPKDGVDLLTWLYVLEGPMETPYEGGVYVGKIVFPPNYPLSPPSIYMHTPSGRFQPDKKLCMSMSDFHPESWNPLWSVATIIQGIQSFMATEEVTTGGMTASTAQRKQLAEGSHAYNEQHFPRLLNGDIPAAFQRSREKMAKKSRERQETAQASTPKTKLSSATSSPVTASSSPPKPELGEAEQEKRRIRNAKKRAKQKAKKSVTREDADMGVKL